MQKEQKRNKFFHHPDGWIFVNDLMMSLDDFLGFEPNYSLPEGFRGREYVPGEFHRLYTSRGEIYFDPVWDKGDIYISKESFYRDELAKRISA